ncbi:Serine/threonine-protein kinase PKH2 [Diplonema papillatum]|nr:Serine/threonine-protein kinase PKH2 [Diplonema papillatum]|eukprot:gene8124-12495_t
MAWAGETIRHEDFDWDNARCVGLGAMAKVYVVQYKDGNTYAVKVASKSALIHGSKAEAAMREKTALQLLCTTPTVGKLFGTFQTDEDLFFVLEFFPRGNLEMLCLKGPVAKSILPHILAEVVKGVQAVHQKGWVHRDVKPENICFREDGSVGLIDFDTAIECSDPPVSHKGTQSIKELSPEDRNRRYTVSEVQRIRRKTQQFVGTSQFISPEMLDSCTWSYASDLWAVGCVAYQMGTGRPAFWAKSQFDVFKRVVKASYDEAYIPYAALKDFCQRVLVVDPTQRLGTAFPPSSAEYLSDLKRHPLFEGVDWDNPDFPLILAAAPCEDAEYVRKMANSTEDQPFDDWVDSKYTAVSQQLPIPFIRPPPCDEAADDDAAPVSPASDDSEPANVVDDTKGGEEYAPFHFP